MLDIAETYMSEERQAILESFWRSEQIRIKPNIRYLLNASAFHKHSEWDSIAQYVAQYNRGIGQGFHADDNGTVFVTVTGLKIYIPHHYAVLRKFVILATP